MGGVLRRAFKGFSVIYPQPRFSKCASQSNALRTKKIYPSPYMTQVRGKEQALPLFYPPGKVLQKERAGRAWFTFSATAHPAVRRFIPPGTLRLNRLPAGRASGDKEESRFRAYLPAALLSLQQKSGLQKTLPLKALPPGFRWIRSRRSPNACAKGRFVTQM